MDEETKKIFDDLIGEKTKRKSAVYEKYTYRPSAERMDPFEMPPHRHSRPEPAATVYKRPEPSPSTEESNTLEHIAVLSVNSAKACIVFRAPTNTKVREEIKRVAGPGQATFNAKDGVWELHPAILASIKLVLKTHYKDVQVLGVQKQVQATKFDQLMAKLSKDDKDKIYKLLALKYHPDRGGDKDTMVLINLVFKGGI